MFNLSGEIQTLGRPVPTMLVNRSSSVLSQGSLTEQTEDNIVRLNNAIDDLLEISDGLPQAPALRARQMASDCRSMADGLRGVPENIPHLNQETEKVAQCIRDIESYIDDQITALEKEIEEGVGPTRDSLPPVQDRIIGMDPTVFWVGTAAAAGGLIALLAS